LARRRVDVRAEGEPAASAPSTRPPAAKYWRPDFAAGAAEEKDQFAALCDIT